jgi:alpha-glucosidase (family GH31 glycosyl hydrolase)
MYARWVQFGALQPIERLHSNHGHRLPWNYPKPADRAAAAALRLRESLVPYLYTAARESHDTGLPITRNLYLTWPHQRAAYRHPAEYTLGDDLLVRPVTSGGSPARTRVWFPPGRWVDYFTGRAYSGPGSRTMSVPLKRMPLFVRAGAVLPTQPYAPYTRVGSPRQLVLTVYPGGDGTGGLYDDRGTGFGYRHGRFSWTVLRHSVSQSKDVLRIGAARGHYASEPSRRSWTVRFVGVARPLRVMFAGRPARSSYDARSRTLTVRVARRSTGRPSKVVVMR